MAGDTHELGNNYPDIFSALGDLDSGQFLDSNAVGHIVSHRGQVIESVGQRYYLCVSAAFGQLLYPAVQIPDDRLYVRHDFAVQGHPQPKYAVSRRMLRAYIKIKWLGFYGHFYK